MSKEEVKAQIIVTVSVTSGEKILHTYPLPSNGKEIEKLLDKITDMIADGLVERTSFTLAFENPFSVYNRDHVISVGYRGVGSKELKEHLAKLTKKKMGYLKD